jgi:predicted N-acetyltransferase YhbS
MAPWPRGAHFRALRQRSVAFVVTYGDPGFYGKVGFQALSEDTVQAPIEVAPVSRTPYPAVNAEVNLVHFAALSPK